MKTIEEMTKNAEYVGGMRDKLASMQRALDAEDPSEFLKLAKTITSEDYGKLSSPVLTKISSMLAKADQLQKNADEGPGNPTGVAPTDHDTPVEEKTEIQDGGLPEGKTDPQIDLEGGKLIEQAPGTSPSETDLPVEITESDKKAFVLRSVKNGIDRACNTLIKESARKRGVRLAGIRRTKTAEAMLQGLIDEYGEENVAPILKEAAQRGTQAAIDVLNGGTNG